MLLPNTSLETARGIAEQLIQKIGDSARVTRYRGERQPGRHPPTLSLT